MPKQQTKYCKQWESSRPWRNPGSSKYLRRCRFCNKEFQVGGTGVIQLDSHARSGNSQRTLCSTSSEQLSTSGEDEVELSPAMQGLRAEIIETMHKVECNQSFASATNDGMFPNHPASKHYHCSSRKSSYLLRYGIAEVLFEEIKNDIIDVPPTVKFDESNTS